MKKLRSKKERGITLVALVVTIVVLLVLAGVTINLVLSDDGIFKKAEEVGEKTERAKFEERLKLVEADAMMERAVKGRLSPGEFFEILKNHEIISDVTVPGGNITSETENEDGSKTYEITSEDDNIFEATIYPNGKVETQWIGKDGSIEPKIRSIAVTSKTKTEIGIKISARVQGGTVKAYYKKLSEVAENELDSDITGYTDIPLNDANSNSWAGTATGLEAGVEYKIKAILEKDGAVVSSKAITARTGVAVAVSSITIEPASETVDEGKEITLTATIQPIDAVDKSVTWSSSDETIATVDQNGKVTGIKAGEATITATSNDMNTVKAQCNITVQEAESDWAYLNRVAIAIAEADKMTEAEKTAAGIIDTDARQKGKTSENEEYDIEIGNDAKSIFKVKYTPDLTKPNEYTILKVRVLGFKHDDLAEGQGYEGMTGVTKASISFEFIEFLGANQPMHSSNDNSVGWKGSTMRSYLNGSSDTTKGGLVPNLSNKDYIKKVTKPYLLGTNATTASLDCSDWLWLLSCSEIWDKGKDGQPYGFAKAKEGERYTFYSIKNPNGSTNDANTDLQKGPKGGVAYDWWLRSPYCDNSNFFCIVTSTGYSAAHFATNTFGVAPGFSI